MPKVKKEISVQRETTAWDLRTRKGYTHAKIAEDLGLERSAVTKILRRVSSRASKEMLDEAVEEKITQIAQLHTIVEESMQAWERSKDAAKTMTQYLRAISIEGANGEQKNTTLKVEEQAGDARYLETAMKAMAEIRKLLGIDSPAKLMNINLDNLTDQQLERLAKGEDLMSVLVGVETHSSKGKSSFLSENTE